MLDKNKLKNLNPKESLYTSLMISQSGVPYIQSKPGFAKSAIIRGIANKLDMKFFDLRLSMIDETDIGLFPNKEDYTHPVSGEKQICLNYVVPKWALLANEQPTIVLFEELNRAQLAVRNASLQILLERAIGTHFKFNDNVYFMATGNLGDEDNTDVEEFDAALNNRLIHIKHSMSPQEWLDMWGNENLHPAIIAYIKANPDEYYKTKSADEKDKTGSSAFATPRTWTFLSDFIISNYGKESSPQEWLWTVSSVGTSFIGNSNVGFIKFCESRINLSIKDIMDDYDNAVIKLKGFNHDKIADLIGSLKEIKFTDINDKQLMNLIKFIKLINPEQRHAYLLHLIDTEDTEDPKVVKFTKPFMADIIKMNDLNSQK